MDNWIGVVGNKLKDIFDKLSGHDNRFDALDRSVTSAEQNIIGKIGDMSTSVNGIQLVKSIQRKVYYMSANTSSGTCKLNPSVNPKKCLVIFERLHDNTSGHCFVDYTLDSTSITISHTSYSASSNKSATFGFWVVEFY